MAAVAMSTATARKAIFEDRWFIRLFLFSGCLEYARVEMPEAESARGLNLDLGLSVRSRFRPARRYPIELADRQESDEQENDGQEDQARRDRTPAPPPGDEGFCDQIACRGAKGTGQYVGEPEGQNAIHLQRVVQQGDDSDHRAKDGQRLSVSEVEPLRQQVAQRSAHGEGEQDRCPVKELASYREDGVDRERSLHERPDREDGSENQPEGDRCGDEADSHAVHEIVGDER